MTPPAQQPWNEPGERYDKSLGNESNPEPTPEPAPEPESEFYLLLLKASKKDNPSDVEKLITELKNTQAALYYVGSLLRELDASNMVRREDDRCFS
jgi:hypothetical protein